MFLRTLPDVETFAEVSHESLTLCLGQVIHAQNCGYALVYDQVSDPLSRFRSQREVRTLPAKDLDVISGFLSVG